MTEPYSITPASFTVVMRGYDREQVDLQINQLSSALSKARAAVEQLDGNNVKLVNDLTDAQRQLREVDRPSYAGLGARIEQLLRLAEEQAVDMVTAAQGDADQTLAQARTESYELRASAEAAANELNATSTRQARERLEAANDEAEDTLATAQRKAEEELGTAQRHAEMLRAAVEQEATEKRLSLEREVGRLRATAEREITELRAKAKREADELRLIAKRESDDLTLSASSVLEAAEAKAKQDASDHEVALASQREEAERLDAERHEAAIAKLQELTRAAESRAAAAEARATRALEKAESIRAEAEEHHRTQTTAARVSADQTVADAKAHADKIMSDARAEAERQRGAAQRQVEDLQRQRDSITSHLDQLRGLLGSMPVPGLEGLSSSPAVVAPSPAAAARASAPADPMPADPMPADPAPAAEASGATADDDQARAATVKADKARDKVREAAAAAALDPGAFFTQTPAASSTASASSGAAVSSGAAAAESVQSLFATSSAPDDGESGPAEPTSADSHRVDPATLSQVESGLTGDAPGPEGAEADDEVADKGKTSPLPKRPTGQTDVDRAKALADLRAAQQATTSHSN